MNESEIILINNKTSQKKNVSLNQIKKIKTLLEYNTHPIKTQLCRIILEIF